MPSLPPTMHVIERAVYRGPHRFSNTPMVRVQLDLGPLQDLPTDRLNGFNDHLLDALPTLLHHGCSGRRPGGFVRRLRDGTWIGHVVEHVALELQHLAGHRTTRGKTRAVPGHPGVYNVMFAYVDREVGLAAARMALELVCRLLPRGLNTVAGLDLLGSSLVRDPRDGIVSGLIALRAMVRRTALGPTTQSLVDAARARGIPTERLNERSLIRLGTGSAQAGLRASITSACSSIAVETAGNKAEAKAVLQRAGVPVPRGSVVTSAERAVDAARRIEGPVVTKPLDGNHGRGVTLHLLNDDEVRRGFESAAAHSRKVIVEEQYSGRDYRVLVVGGAVVAVAERVPASVVGDGVSTVRALIDDLNADPRRGIGHRAALSRVVVDDDLRNVLSRQGLKLKSVPESGIIVGLRDAANISTGGEAIDATEHIHPDVSATAVRAAAHIGLDVAGVDLITPDIARPLAQAGGGIVEVNAAPGFRMHLHPSVGKSRDVGGAVIDMLYPPGSVATVPVIAVTGSNGKSTVVRMLARIYEGTGKTVGMTNTSGVYVGGRRIVAGDCSGPQSARLVLADPTVDVAVLETARGGIVREGLGFDGPDIGVVLNVTGDHLGIGGVDTLRQLAEVKSVVVRSVRRGGTSVLNADDPMTLSMARHAGGRLALFTEAPLAYAPTALREHVDRGGLAATVEPSSAGGRLTLHDSRDEIPLMPAEAIPATLGGIAAFNVQNAIAAALAAHAQGVDRETIIDGLCSFESSFDDNPGRLNITRAPGFTVIVDYGHNPPALRALGDVLARMRPDHDRVIGVIGTPGDRRDEDILELGRICAHVFDEVIFRERPDGRGRAAGGVVSLLTEGARAAGMAPNRIRRILDERQAMDAALRSAGPRDLVVLTPTDVEAVWQQAISFRPARTRVRA